MNLLTTAAAIATAYASTTATNGSQTEGLTLCTHLLPDQLPGKGPVLLVYPPTGVLSVGVSRIRADEMDFPVRLMRDPASYPIRTGWAYAWFDALRDVIRDGETLGLSYVSWARLIEARVEIDGAEYAGAPYGDLVELTVRIHFGDLQP